MPCQISIPEHCSGIPLSIRVASSDFVGAENPLDLVGSDALRPQEGEIEERQDHGLLSRSLVGESSSSTFRVRVVPTGPVSSSGAISGKPCSELSDDMFGTQTPRQRPRAAPTVRPAERMRIRDASLSGTRPQRSL